MEHGILPSDEATFLTSGNVNRPNCRIWAEEWELVSPDVIVWTVDTKSKVCIGPFMFTERTMKLYHLSRHAAEFC